MNNEKHFFKTPFLFFEEFNQVTKAINIAKNFYSDQRDGTLDWDYYCEKRIEEFERVLDKLNSASWRELPEPTKEI
jgi:hypothetical protein